MFSPVSSFNKESSFSICLYLFRCIYTYFGREWSQIGHKFLGSIWYLEDILVWFSRKVKFIELDLFSNEVYGPDLPPVPLVDWADEKHNIYITNDSGKELACFQISNDRKGMLRLLAKTQKLYKDTSSVLFTMEKTGWAAGVKPGFRSIVRLYSYSSPLNLQILTCS